MTTFRTSLAQRAHPISITVLDSCLVIQLRNRPRKYARAIAFEHLQGLFDLDTPALAAFAGKTVVPLLLDTDQIHLSARLLSDRGWIVNVSDRRGPVPRNAVRAL